MNTDQQTIQIETNEEELAAVRRFLCDTKGTYVIAPQDRMVAKAVLRRVTEAASKRSDPPTAAIALTPTVETLLYARCVKHFRVPQLNKAEASGAECGACIAEGVGVSGTYPVVLRFAAYMERKLEANCHKGGRENWIQDDSQSLLERLRQETNELQVQVQVARAFMGEPANARTMAERVFEEAADVANFAMMIADGVMEQALAAAIKPL